ncbi:lysosomal Pro-X carboxypeptidase-like [Rhodamnia argentea]|uniref:Lysosomal Pro-X carboxypeptidase-like n=1 Tax=Rhodamnia argentea TaxID=178133 RepID=A0A8B8NIK7_9MYRT|nr:lysosomal Pro-X carboxypeptidase-like [Rhodamnia argentea]
MTTIPGMSSHCCLWIALIFLSASVATAHNLDHVDIPKLRMSRPEFLRDPASTAQASVSKDFATFFYNQTLDHFNYRPESYTAFNQRYVVNSKYWGGAESGAPIFAFLGAEAPIDGDIGNAGFLTDNAPQFRALLVYIEHRFYGESIPYGMTFAKALGDANNRGYFSSAQALADYAEILTYLKQKLKAEHSPIIVFGGSYGGMLASWFRLKYPHVALGALASSAPILYFDDIVPQDAYFSVVAKSFLESSSSCHQTIRQSWEEIDRAASEPHGLTKLTKTFKTCSPLKSSSELKKYLRTLYAQVVQYNDPSAQPLKLMCDAINGASPRNGLLRKIFAGLVAINGNLTCYVNSPTSATLAQTLLGWSWQTCSEMVIPMGITRNTMFPPKPFNLNSFSNACKRVFRVAPRPHWITTYFGGHDIKLILWRFASNIIFSNGLQDPYSSGGVLKNISSTIVAIHTAKGSHTLDILGAKKSDPDWLVEQRKTEVEIMKMWLATYYVDLRTFKN